jgi:hypothetical protein
LRIDEFPVIMIPRFANVFHPRFLKRNLVPTKRQSWDEAQATGHHWTKSRLNIG